MTASSEESGLPEHVVDVRDVRLRAEGPSGARDVLTGVSFVVRRGERVAIVGHSGSGKTTVLNIVGGLEPDFTGEVLLNGERVWSRPAGQRAAYRNTHIGFVFQDSNLIQGLTAEENLTLPLIVEGTPARRERVHELLRRFGLETRASTRVERLSGGERQRVAMARALVAEPSILLVDEPTGNLDGANAFRIIDALIEYQTTHGATMLIASHDARVVDRAERTLHMEAGALNGTAP